MNRKEIAIGDVYYAKVECNGSVQGGYRPYVVMQKDIGNKYSPNVVLIPLTTAIKKEKMPTHVVIRCKESGLPKDSVALCENPISFPKEELGEFITKLPQNIMKDLAVANSLASSAISFLNLDELLAL